MKCPSNREICKKMYGFGFLDQGYHCLNIPGPVKTQKNMENMGLIRVKSGDDSVARMEMELKHLIDEKWQWQVKKVATKEYVATFPNKQILDTFSRSNGFDMALYKMFVTITPTRMDPAVPSVLQEGRVQIHELPDFARSVEEVTTIAERAGEVMVADEVSLIKVGLVRVKVRAQEIVKIHMVIWSSLWRALDMMQSLCQNYPRKIYLSIQQLRPSHRGGWLR